VIRAAVVGLGWWGVNISRSLESSDRIRVVLGVDPDPAGRANGEAAGLETTDDLGVALARDDIDAVIICSPHRFHLEHMLASAEAGKHIFCEKPFSTSAAEAEIAIAAAERAGVRVGIGHERRFEPAMIELQERCASGDLGTILAFEGNFSQDKFLNLDPGNWRLSATEAPVGPLSATAIHLVDLAISILGEPVNVLARLSTLATTFANGDTLSVMLTFAGGQTAVITATLTTPFVGRVAVYGSEGWMEIRDRSHPENSSGWDVATVHRGEDPVTEFMPPYPSVRENLERFADSVAGVGTYPVTHREILANVRTFEAISRSALSEEIELVWPM
jgi:predicted dehydrogenase